MKRSLFYHPLVKVICFLLCLESFAACAVFGFRLIYMDMNNVYGGAEEFTPYFGLKDTLGYPSYDTFYLITGDMAVGRDYGYWDNSVLSDQIKGILQTEIRGETASEFIRDGGCVYPASAKDSALALFKTYGADNSNLAFRVTSGDTVLLSNMEGDSREENDYVMQFRTDFTLCSAVSGYDPENAWMRNEDKSSLHCEGRYYDCTLFCGLKKDLPVDDIYKTFFTACRKDHDRMVQIAAATLFSGVCALLLLGAVLMQSGVRRDEGKIHLYFIDRVPFEIVGAAEFFLCGVLISVLADGIFWWDSIGEALGWVYGYLPASAIPGYVILMTFLGIACGLVLLLTVIGALCGLTRRLRTLRTEKSWKNTLVYLLLVPFRKLFSRMHRAGGEIVSHIPLVWKLAAAVAAFAVFNFIMVFAIPDSFFAFLLWLLAWSGVLVLLCLYAVGLDKIRRATDSIAAGNLNSSVDTASMRGAPRRMADNLNHIEDAMNRAVNERMKSERFRTELITNVSHDIKTPLTAIISYTDLLSREEPENERMREYIEVLSRQSARLKKLTEDLLEASKASSGTLSVTLSETDAAELLAQAAGEYGERFEKAGLTPVLHVPDEPLVIRADGRHLWRVFDNLLSNICKYSMRGTRVYLTAAALDGHAVLSFRNISGTELNIDAAELTERFVRGDASRHTEGSGLGLAIAKSLTELQGGSMEVAIDGDLFKVVVDFSLL